MLESTLLYAKMLGKATETRPMDVISNNVAAAKACDALHMAIAWPARRKIKTARM
ncbi:hypothetical protein EV175_005955, partial [Coemansia sp. RSA 1933]